MSCNRGPVFFVTVLEADHIGHLRWVACFRGQEVGR